MPFEYLWPRRPLRTLSFQDHLLCWQSSNELVVSMGILLEVFDVKEDEI